jgi:mitochondrial import receptor subunit TOM70
MYEKALIYELALDDCDYILNDLGEMHHPKARLRKLRILETLQRYKEALVEICALQLLFMQQHRPSLQRQLPIPAPPIPQHKMEEVLNHILPGETDRYVQQLNERTAQQPLPGTYTILQLLRSYTEYNIWMARAAQSGSVPQLTQQLQKATDPPAEQVRLLFLRGRRHVYDRHYEDATADLEQAYALVQQHPDVIAALPDDTYARLLEWTGMVRHWHYRLDAALQCLEEAATIEPKNALLIVKQAGVQLDAGKQEEALVLFDRALQLDSQSVDALLHRSNLRIMQGKPELAKTDLETCLRLRPGHTMARLRLASILVPMENMDGARRQIDLAQQSEPNSSEVHSYRGELHFALGEMEEARQAFEKAIQLEPFNPTPYVNAAMAMINTPPSSPGEMPDTAAIIRLLEQAIQVDPQFSAAYVHLGQLKLGTATTLAAAREVIALYDTALEKCRTPEEIKELCGMRVLAVAQVEAAEQLQMETFNMS